MCQFHRICVFRRLNICHPIFPGSVIRHTDAAHSTVQVGSVVVPIHVVLTPIYFAPQVVFLHRTDPVWDATFRLIHSGQILEASASIFCSLAFASVSFVRFSNVPIFRWRFELLAAKLRLVIHFPLPDPTLAVSSLRQLHLLSFVVVSMSEFNKSVLSASTVHLFSASTLRCSVTVIRQKQSGRIH